MTVAAADHPTAPRNAGKHNNGGFTPGSSQWHTAGDGEPALVLACGSFRANYGPALDLFASLATPIVGRALASSSTKQRVRESKQIDRAIPNCGVPRHVVECKGSWV